MIEVLRCTVNNKPVEVGIDPRESLADVLRERLGLTSVKKGCEVGECGACTVLVDGTAIDSCIYLGVWAQGKSILTVEGLQEPDGGLSPHPAGLCGGGRRPVRLLHPRHHHVRRGDRGLRQAVHLGGAAQAHLRPPVPLHRLPEYSGTPWSGRWTRPTGSWEKGKKKGEPREPAPVLGGDEGIGPYGPCGIGSQYVHTWSGVRFLRRGQ